MTLQDTPHQCIQQDCLPQPKLCAHALVANFELVTLFWACCCVVFLYSSHKLKCLRTMTSPFGVSQDQQGSMADATGLLPSSTSTPTSATAAAYTNVLNGSVIDLAGAAAAKALWSPVSSPTHTVHKDPIAGLQVPCLVAQASTASSCTSTSNLSETADGSQPSSASAVSAALQLFAGNTADEVQLMAARVLQRKNQAGGSSAAAPAAEHASDPLLLLHSPEKNLRARKEQLMLLKASSSAAGQSARVAAAKEELAGVQARLRDALGLKEDGSDEVSHNTIIIKYTKSTTS